MAYKSFLATFCLLFSSVTALQTSIVQDEHFNPGAPENNGIVMIRSWVSMNGLFCAQAPARVAEGALALFKAMPRGELYNLTAVHAKNDTCEELGYKLSTGEDPCYPELMTFYRSEEEKKNFWNALNKTLENFGNRYNLSHEDVQMLDSCSCHDNSAAKKSNFCDKVNDFPGSWVHRVPETGLGLMCDSGPYLFATRALAVLKSTCQLPMHLTDQIAPIGCDKLGFPNKHPPIDHCFTGLHMWLKTPDLGTDVLIAKCGAVEGGLMHGGFTNYSETHGLNKNILDGIAGCHCAANSEVGKSMKEICVYPGVTSPIRDWWKE